MTEIRSHEELARERWSAHAEQHDGLKQLDAERWRGHERHHESIARSLIEYKAQSNEWRGSLSDLRITFASKSDLESIEAQMRTGFESLRQALAEEREERRDQQNLRVGAQRGIGQGTAIVVGAVGFVGVVLSIIVIMVNFLSSAP
jgi:hypothetical protein